VFPSVQAPSADERIRRDEFALHGEQVDLSLRRFALFASSLVVPHASLRASSQQRGGASPIVLSMNGSAGDVETRVSLVVVVVVISLGVS
jgi:hypothetical protein